MTRISAAGWCICCANHGVEKLIGKKHCCIVRSSAAEYLTFITATGESDVNAVYCDENVWLTQKMMGLLYITDKRLHHEIYLSDARKVAPEKCKTVIRHPIKKA